MPFINDIAYRASTGEQVSWTWASGGSYLESFDANDKVSGVSDTGVLNQATAFDAAMRLTSLNDNEKADNYCSLFFDRKWLA